VFDSSPARVPLVSGDLRIDCAKRSDQLVLEWRGRSTDRSPAQTVGPYVRALFDGAVERKLGVEMDFRALTHFNSSTITAIIQLIQDARAKNVPLTLVYDASSKTQKLSFEALRVFAQDGVLALRPTPP
jgi:hypothetical protein